MDERIKCNSRQCLPCRYFQKYSLYLSSTLPWCLSFSLLATFIHRAVSSASRVFCLILFCTCIYNNIVTELVYYILNISGLRRSPLCSACFTNDVGGFCCWLAGGRVWRLVLKIWQCSSLTATHTSWTTAINNAHNRANQICVLKVAVCAALCV